MRTLKALRTIFQTAAATTIACSGGGVDRGSFDLDVCDGTTYRSLVGITEANPANYVELRFEDQQFNTMPMMPPNVRVIEKDGTLCGGAMDMTACSSKLSSLRTGAGFAATSGGQLPQWQYLAYTRNDEVGSVTTKDALVSFLSPIDTAKDAALVAMVSGQGFVCDGKKNARKTATGWELYTQTGGTCGPNTGIDEHVVAVSTAGVVTVLNTNRIKNGDPNCAIGRRPEGLVRAPSHGEGVGAFFADAARLEAASVIAFERLANELRAHGAPADLVRDARRAAKDEIRHARSTKAIAERWGATCVEARIDDARTRDLLAIAIENAVEGCVRETFGALVATYQSMKAGDRTIARAMKGIAIDETRHASLAWRIAEWIETKLDASEREIVRRARLDAAARLREELALEHDAEVRTHAGMPSADDAARLYEEVAPMLWAA